MDGKLRISEDVSDQKGLTSHPFSKVTGITRPNPDQTIELADGRRLGYAIYGPREGSPLDYFHGHPGSRLELTLFEGLEEILERLNLRMYAVDRPGIGLSDMHPRRKFSDWPTDVIEFADRVLKVEWFNLLTYSAGGPYGLVCG